MTPARALPIWIGHGAIGQGKHPPGGGALALLADLDDPSIQTLVGLAPTARDIADAAKPLAGPRTYFFKRRSLLRHLAGLWISVDPRGVEIGHDAAGAPRVLSPKIPVFVSVAARGSRAALAIAATPVGVDIEPRDAAREPAWHALHNDERELVEDEWRTGNDDLFRRLWVAKEAYLKALRTGFTRDPSHIHARFDSAGMFSITDVAVTGRRQRTGIIDAIKMGDQMIDRACIVLD